jgi:hypothetical protein
MEIARTPQGVDPIPHLARSGTATQLIVGGKPFIMLAGEVHNPNSSSLAFMESMWPHLVSLHLNTVLLPIAWEMIEPQEGEFCFDLVDGLIQAARQHGLKLVPLWFGTWKNGRSTYVPAWVKTDMERFGRLQEVTGQNTSVISSLSEAACEADIRAFRAMMHHIREVDGQEHTVIMVQVENETGIWGFTRDHCPAAEARFAQAVPAELMAYLEAHTASLHHELRQSWEEAGRKGAGTWAEVFGRDADEVFTAWHIARYVDRVTAAGKDEYPLPMYANAALAWLDGYRERQLEYSYFFGGPTPRMMDVWRAAGPHIDLLGPDIYLPDFRTVCREYTRAGNPLMIPEANHDEWAAANAFYAIAHYDAMCFAPYGIEFVQPPHPLAASYKLLQELMPVIAQYQGTGRMVGVLQDERSGARFMWGERFELGGYRLHAAFDQPLEKGKMPAAGLIVALSDDEYLIAGTGFTVTFSPRPGGAPHVEIVTLDEGRYQEGEWFPGRRLALNGRGPVVHMGWPGWPGMGSAATDPVVRRVRLYSYT